MNHDHGGNLREFASHFGLKENEVLDFSSSINPLGIPETVRRLYLESSAELTRYPDPSSSLLRGEISKQFSLPAQNILVTNGAMSALQLAVRALAPKRALIIEPCFGEYRRLLEGEGASVRGLLLKEPEGFQFDLEEIAASLPGMDLLVIGHPNNPTGTALIREDLAGLAALAKRENVFVLIDEAFADWVPQISLSGEIHDGANFLVVRSLTKFFSLAGLRAGFALGPAFLIAEMRKRQETWAVNRLAEKLSAALLADVDFQIWSRKWLARESAVLNKELRSISGLKIYPSLANFMLVRASSSGLFEALGSKGIYVRPCGNFGGLDDSYFRIAVRLQAENRFLLEGLRECLISPLPSL